MRCWLPPVASRAVQILTHLVLARLTCRTHRYIWKAAITGLSRAAIPVRADVSTTAAVVCILGYVNAYAAANNVVIPRPANHARSPISRPRIIASAA